MPDAWEGLDEAVAIADAGSFKGAATLLRVSTSHISKVIARLEGRLQTQLFHRTTRKVVLTDTGHSFVEHSRQLIMERDELLASVDNGREPQGEIRITCSISMGERFVAPIVRDFMVRYPQISVTLDLTNRLVDLIGEGYDLAVRTSNISDERLVGRQIAARRLVTIAAPAYLASRGEPRSIAELADHDCLTGTAASWSFLDGGKPQSFTPKGRWRCNNGTAVAEAAAAGLGVCQLPLFYVRQLMNEGALRPIMEDLCPMPEAIWIVYPKRRHVLSKVHALCDELEAKLQHSMNSP